MYARRSAGAGLVRAARQPWDCPCLVRRSLPEAARQPSPRTVCVLPEQGTAAGQDLCPTLQQLGLPPPQPSLPWAALLREVPRSREARVWVTQSVQDGPRGAALRIRVSFPHRGQFLIWGIHILSTLSGRLQIIRPNWIYGIGRSSIQQTSDFSNSLTFYIEKSSDNRLAAKFKKNKKMHYLCYGLLYLSITMDLIMTISQCLQKDGKI